MRISIRPQQIGTLIMLPRELHTAAGEARRHISWTNDSSGRHERHGGCRCLVRCFACGSQHDNGVTSQVYECHVV
jgi:hypothetical protein